ncbi:MAG: hypothetical protein EOM80_08930 [Erysipelotrichia bacterium]|nr:hypothetical protein [Erysipelotrichia bacterium]
MAKKSRINHGFTLVEAVIGMMLISGLLIMFYKAFTYIGAQRARGSVDLQEMQGARYAINYLRRDFRCAAPVIPKTATVAQKKKALHMPIVEAKLFAKGDTTVPILVSDSEIHFFRHLYNTPELSSVIAIEEINYRIDSARKCLVRSGAGKEQVFPDIREAKFELYSHPLKSEIPMLLVTLIIDADLKDAGAGRNFLELTTTISSAIANQNINNPYWYINYD